MKTYLEASKCTMNPNFTSNKYYSNVWMSSLSVTKWWYRITIGSGGRGKTYSGRKKLLKNWMNKRKGFIWLRLTNQAVDNLLQNGAMGLFPIELKRKYKIKTVTNSGNAIYINGKHAGFVASIQGYYNNKGQEIQIPDYSLKTTLRKNKEFENFEIFTDEMIREESERNTFDIKKAFQNQVENVMRTKKGVCFNIWANFLAEIRDIEELFDIRIISGKFGIYRNYKTRAVVEYLEDSKEWKAKQKDTYAGVLNVDGGRFSNKATEENKLIIYNHLLRGSSILFNIKIAHYIFVLKTWKNKLVLCNFKGNENIKKTFVLKPEFMTHGNQLYSEDVRKRLSDAFKAGSLSFTSYVIYSEYVKHMKR